jgi:hypothetical protein
VTNAVRSSEPLEGTNRAAFARRLPPAGQESDRVGETLTVGRIVTVADPDLDADPERPSSVDDTVLVAVKGV